GMRARVVSARAIFEARLGLARRGERRHGIAHCPGLQWIVFFVGALLLSSAMGRIPGLHGALGGVWGFWIAVLLLSALTTRISARLFEHSRMRRRVSELGRVDNAHNQGKLGT